jgi:hypothetical protein
LIFIKIETQRRRDAEEEINRDDRMKKDKSKIKKLLFIPVYPVIPVNFLLKISASPRLCV